MDLKIVLKLAYFNKYFLKKKTYFYQNSRDPKSWAQVRQEGGAPIIRLVLHFLTHFIFFLCHAVYHFVDLNKCPFSLPSIKMDSVLFERSEYNFSFRGP